jgi:O-antigen/teichoic acid export membrane protein
MVFQLSSVVISKALAKTGKELLRLISKDLLRYLPGQLIPALLSILSIPLFTRILSSEQFGQYSLVISSVAIMIILQGWLLMAIIRFYPAVAASQVTILIRTAFWAQIVSVGILVAMGFILASQFLKNELIFQPLIHIGLLIVVLQSTFYLLTHVLRARLQAGLYSFFMIWAKFIGLGLGIIFAVYCQLGTAGILWGIVFGMITSLPYLWHRAFTGVQVIGPISLSLLRELTYYGIPLVVGNLSAWVLSQFDRYLIQGFYGAQAVGVYSAAYSISDNSIRLLSMLFMLASGPLLANAWEKQGQEVSKQLLSSVTRLYLLAGIPIVIGMLAVAKPLMQVLTGPDFVSGYTLIPWVAGGAFFLGLQHRFNQVLLLVKRPKIIMFWLMLSGVLNVLLNWYLLPLYGYDIAAINTFVAYFFLCIALALSSKRHFSWNFPWSTAVRSLLAAGVMFGGVYIFVKAAYLPVILTLCLAIAGGVFIYALSICMVGEISSSEWKALKTVGRQWLSRNTESLADSFDELKVQK